MPRLGSLVSVQAVIAVALLVSAAAAWPAAGEDTEEGVLTTTDGNELRIRFDAVTLTGTARFIWSDGRSYSGDFVDGRPQGRGIEQLPDGSSYDGEWVDGRHEGTGTLILSDGSRYDGSFAAGARSGQGLFQSAAGRFQGEWIDDVPQGHGRFDYTDGASYDGDWFGGRRNGYGDYRRADGSSYSGDWRDDMPDGFGHLVEPDGYTYDGSWSRGQRSGYGAMTIGEGFGYEGTWIENLRQGYGRELRPDGGEYIGQWHQDERDGPGILRTPNGASHDGHWQHNAPLGPGTRVSAEGIRISGSWDGDFVADGTVTLRGGETYTGKLYDAANRAVDAGFLEWLERAANQGNPDAALLIGQAYRFFLQPAPDRAKAELWFSRAAAAGIAEAQYQLAAMMFEQTDTAARGLELLKAAAADGHAGANTRLGVFYQLGTYMPKDQTRARQHYELATSQGDITARNNLAWLLATSPDAELRDGTRAVSLALPLAVLYDSWGYLDTLAAAQAEAGDFAAATRSAGKALTQAAAAADAETLQGLKQRLTLFQRKEPYREP
jgi:hypothetical protein